MRTLLLMRGAPASGKSQWIRDNNLEAYTLEADHFRMLLRSPSLGENGWYCLTNINILYITMNLIHP